MTASSVGKILIVDDEVELKNILVEALTSQGYETSGFSSGEEALVALRAEAFDVLLTDLMMPAMDGITLVRESLQIDPHLVCMMMTGQGTIQTAVDAMKEGAFDYVLKPFRLQTVLPVLTRAMNTRRLRLENLQLRETVAIYELGQTIAFTLDPQTVLSKLADAALQQTDADEVSVLLPAGNGTHGLYVAAVRGEKRERLLGERVPLDESISGWVARARTPLILNGEINDARFRSLWPHPEICSAISIPMQVAGKLVGIININALKRPRPFTLGQMKALTILAGTAAAALESASLYTQVQKAEENYRSIFEHAVEGIFQITPEGRLLTVNPALARILGYGSPEEVIKDLTDVAKQVFVHPEDWAESAHREKANAVLLGFEFEAYRKDGQKIWLSLNRHSVRDENGKELYREGSVEDITERKRAEDLLRQSEILNRSLVEHLPNRIFVKDRNSVYLFCNSNYALDLGIGPKQIVGKDDFAFFSTAHAEGYRADDREVMAAGKTKDIEERYKLAGAERWIHTVKVPYRNQQAEIIGVLGLFEDITERKLAEAQRELLAVVVEASPDFIGYADPITTQIQYINKHGRRMCGIGEDEDVRKLKISDLHPAWMNKRMADVVLPAAVRDGLWEGDGAFLHRNGREVPVLMTLLARKADDGKVDLFYTVSRDITERKRAEEEIKDLAKFPSENPSPVLRLADDGTLLFANAGAGSILSKWGLAAGEKLSDSFLAEVRRAATPGSEKPLELVAGDRIFSFVVASIADAGYMNMYGRDITERKGAEQSLRESEERYRDLVENAHDIIYTHDLQGRYTSMNKAGEQITGYTREEALTLNLTRTVAPEHQDKAREMMSRKLAGEKVTAYEMELIAKDGHRVTVEANTKLVYHDGVPVGVQGMARDVTERKQLEEQLRQSQKMEAIGQLAGGVAHDFNNLLTAINGYSSLALQRLEDDHPIKPYIEEVKKAGDRATNLTRQLLAFGRKQILQPLAINLNGVVLDMNKMLRRLIGEDITLTAKLGSDVGRVMADPGQIEQVLVNLIVNARDAMPQGGRLTIETANVELDREYVSGHVGVQSGNYVMLAVSDTGVGMDEHTEQRIFEPFFTTKEKGKGTGLGLSTVYGIVKQSGGNIWVYSEPGKGTTFKVYLPIVESETRELWEKVEVAPRGGSETVLLVEDEEVVRGLARRILEQAGYSVVEVSKADEALHFCEEHVAEIDLLLTDVVMPEMSGKELADRVKSQRPDLKMLFMSGYTDEAIVHHGVLDSSVEFIQKPFTPAGLARKVREVLDQVVVSD